LAIQRSWAWKWGDGCGWGCMLAREYLQVKWGWVVGRGSRMWWCRLGNEDPIGCGWDAG